MAKAVVKGVELEYDVVGDGFPLLLLHAGGLDGRMWDDQFLPFSERYRTIRCDLRGHGRSGWVDAPFAHRHDVAGLLDLIETEQAFVVGLSLGAAVALDVALEYPSKVAALVLACPGLGGHVYPEHVVVALAPLIDALRAGNLEQARNRWLELPFYRTTLRHPTAGPRLRAMVNRYSFADWSRARAAFDRPLDPPAAARLSDIGCPILVVTADEDDPAVLAVADRLASEIGATERVVIRNAGHLANMERPAEFNRAVLGFLGRM